MKVYSPQDNTLVKAWVDGVEFEDAAQKQVENVAKLPFIHHHVAVMPDVHWGMGATVGSVIPTKGAIIPAAVGVDIGCGMLAVRTTLTASDLPDNLHAIRSAIEAAVPHGRTDNGGANDKGAWQGTDREKCDRAEKLGHFSALRAIEPAYFALCGKYPEIEHRRVEGHIGTLGTGNHFIEVCLDEGAVYDQDLCECGGVRAQHSMSENHHFNAAREEPHVWVMLHSGSRGPGNRIGQYFIEKAKREMERWFIHLPDKDLAYLPEGSELFDDYVSAVSWAQDYAKENRRLMMEATLKALQSFVKPFACFGSPGNTVIDCHHNYVEKENHFGANVWVTRKGAVRARKGGFGIIPGSMGVRSYIVRGLGNPESFDSCSHGAGRRMSRGEARKRFTVVDHEAATAGVECRKDAEVVDETPGAYKSIDAVMEAQRDLVEVVHTLKQVVCVKG